jgi:hypothetical protein
LLRRRASPSFLPAPVSRQAGVVLDVGREHEAEAAPLRRRRDLGDRVADKVDVADHAGLTDHREGIVDDVTADVCLR